MTTNTPKALDPLQPQRAPRPSPQRPRQIASSRQTRSDAKTRARPASGRTHRAPRPGVIPTSGSSLEQRRRALWLAVTLSTIIIVAAWMFFLRTVGQKESTQPDGFQKISQEISRFFASIGGDTSGSATNVNDAQEERLRDLRRQVFPELEEQSQ